MLRRAPSRSCEEKAGCRPLCKPLTLHPPSAAPLHFLLENTGWQRAGETSGASKRGGGAAVLGGGILGQGDPGRSALWGQSCPR